MIRRLLLILLDNNPAIEISQNLQDTYELKTAYSFKKKTLNENGFLLDK
jgi:hypothetical protein